MAINVNFNLRDPKCKCETPINIVIRYQRIQIVHFSGERITPKDWEFDKKKKNFQRAKSNYIGYYDLNIRLENIKSKIISTFRKFLDEHNRIPVKTEFKELLPIVLGQCDKNKHIDNDLFTFINLHIENSKTRFNIKTGKLLSKNTIKPYITLKKHLINFQREYNRKLDWNTMDKLFYNDFTNYLNRMKMKVNSIGKQFQVLNSFIRHAEELGLIEKNTIPSFKVIREEVDNICLTEAELTELISLDLSDNKKLDLIRDLFVIGCYTGARFSDISKYNFDNIDILNGEEIFTIVQQKTQAQVSVPVHPIVKKILCKYEGKIEKIPCEQNVNRKLKEMASLLPSMHEYFLKKNSAGNNHVVDKIKRFSLVSTHTARRTFASHLISKNIPAYLVMNVTGHKSEKDFWKYVKLPNRMKTEQLSKMWIG